MVVVFGITSGDGKCCSSQPSAICPAYRMRLSVLSLASNFAVNNSMVPPPCENSMIVTQDCGHLLIACFIFARSRTIKEVKRKFARCPFCVHSHQPFPVSWKYYTTLFIKTQEFLFDALTIFYKCAMNYLVP